MAYCSFCGKKLEQGARFCSACGKPVDKTVQETPAESAHCPSCGHLISALAVTCPACGYEIKKREVSHSIKELSDKLEAIDKKRDSLIRGVIRSFNGNSLSEKAEEKAQVIRSYPIPNTKNDVFELMYMTISNVNASISFLHVSEDGSQRIMPHSVLPIPLRFIAVCPEEEAGDPGRGLGHRVADGFRVGALVGFDDELVVDVAADAGEEEDARITTNKGMTS